MKQSRKQREIAARRAADPIAQIVERTDIDYSDPDQLPTAPRATAVAAMGAIAAVADYSKQKIASCCADWAPSITFSGQTGKPFIYCPWCGIFRADFERDMAMKLSEARSKGLV